jgi:Asp-tRNA(Asn)/Glu-tRNA(Gln) amidotransferase A subunit family amidase
MGPDVVADMTVVEELSGIDTGHLHLLRLTYQARVLEKVHEQGIDMIVSPTEPMTPPTIGTLKVPFANQPDVDVTAVMCGLTGVFNVLGWPAISVPCGTDALGMPVGLQIAARPWAEVDCLAAAAVVERELS